MRTFQGQNPEHGRAHTCKSWPSEKKLCKVPESIEVHIIDDDDSSKDCSVVDASNQLVLYNPEITHDKQSDIDHYTLPRQISKKPRYGYGTVLPSIGAYTVQCANCYKWRIVPTKEKYEELRETISQELFVCTRASEWNRELSCDEPEDMSQDGSRVWAIDKPNIAQPPPGWDREVRIRGASSKFADVYVTLSYFL
ncbi:Methyl-CpG-binding domain-containing protein 2 [Dichanthelium oligosanthes]|uniref:Methyl-CpG-binding domain-containing protein 2 n=1 Tax=Dichanthelium oligosanthes TaxID=888268 RepID=A0A1E5WN08_9POAL|nr:Methyl-CpG-binding domain-containing protein 2 [Dichanthelium oligosanthes]